MTPNDQDERLRQEAAGWFARVRGPGAEAHRADFDAWRTDPANGRAYDRLVARFNESVVLGSSRLAEMRLRTGRPQRDLTPVYALAGALAACVVAAIALGAVVFRGGQGATHYATAVGQIRSIMLADGSTMVLDTDSAATAATRGGRQTVRLERGRARFVVAGDLTVQAGEAGLEAKDATFDLALAARGETAVTVLSGQPRLTAAAARLLPASAPLAAGREVRFGPGLSAPRITSASKVEASWPSGMRAFDQAPLSDVAAIANRYNTRKIRFAEPSLGALRVSGAFRVTGSENLAKGLAAAFGLSVNAAPGGDIVLSRAST